MKRKLLVAAALGLVAVPVVPAGELDDVVAAGARAVEVAQASQQRVDQVVEQTRDLETEYDRIVKEADGLRVYSGYMERQIADQLRELEELHGSIDRVSSMERQVMPLMIRMLDGLEEFVELDVPFLREERRNRVSNLRALMDRADVTVAEKFRALTEAFQVENDFGRTIEAYRETLTPDGSTLEVNVLRIGRVGLFYQTNDAARTGMWDRARGEWIALEDGRSRNQVRQGLRMAEKRIAPDLLLLPLPAPEGASS